MEFTVKYRSRIVTKSISPFVSVGSKVLDIGCGDGVASYELKNFFGFDLVGTDILSYLKRDIKFKQMSKNEELDFADKEFDVGLFIDVLHHVPFESQVKLVKEALRVCSEVLIFEVKPTLTAKLFDRMTNRIHNPNMFVPLTHRTKSGWAELFRSNSLPFEVYTVRKPVFFYPLDNCLFRLKSSRLA